MPGTIRVHLIEAEEPASLQGNTFWIRISLGLRVYHFLCERQKGGITAVDRNCAFPVGVNLSTPLVLEMLEGPDSSPLSFTTLSVGTILESKNREAVLNLNHGGKIRVNLAFVLSDVERAKIAAMRVEGALRRTSSLEPKHPEGHPSALHHPPEGLEANRAWHPPANRNSFVRAVVENEANRDPRAPNKPLDGVPRASRLQRAPPTQALYRGDDSFANADFVAYDSSEESLSSSPDVQPGGDGAAALSPIREDDPRANSNGSGSSGTSGYPQQAIVAFGSHQHQASLMSRTPRTSHAPAKYKRRTSNKTDGVKGALSNIVSQFIAVCATAAILSLMRPKPRKCARCHEDASPDRPGFSLYTVKRGDTLNSLVPHGDFCDPKSRFRSLNPEVCDINKIYAGQVLKLP